MKRLPRPEFAARVYLDCEVDRGFMQNGYLIVSPKKYHSNDFASRFGELFAAQKHKINFH